MFCHNTTINEFYWDLFKTNHHNGVHNCETEGKIRMNLYYYVSFVLFSLNKSSFQSVSFGSHLINRDVQSQYKSSCTEKA